MTSLLDAQQLLAALVGRALPLPPRGFPPRHRSRAARRAGDHLVGAFFIAGLAAVAGDQVGFWLGRRFVVWNVSGAITWVGTMVLLGHIPGVRHNIDAIVLIILGLSVAPLLISWLRKGRGDRCTEA